MVWCAPSPNATGNAWNRNLGRLTATNQRSRILLASIPRETRTRHRPTIALLTKPGTDCACNWPPKSLGRSLPNATQLCDQLTLKACFANPFREATVLTACQGYVA